MTDLIAAAYGVEPAKVLAGPSWLDTDRYDVIAKVPVAQSPEAIRGMRRSLFADRFGLTVHASEQPIRLPCLCCSKLLRWPQISTWPSQR
jgi:uncharacterized protein (TIGR03435 family)